MLYPTITYKNPITNISYFPNVCCHTKFQDPSLSGVSVAPISNICMSAMSLLLTAGKYKAPTWGGLRYHKVDTKFRENLLVLLKLK